VAFVLLLSLYILKDEDISHDDEPTFRQQPLQVDSVHTKPLEAIKVPDTTGVTSLPIQEDINALKIEDELRLWQAESWGYYYSGAAPSDYDGYDLNTLIMMGEQGDLKALDMLAHKYMKVYDYEKARKTYKQSAVLGSTYALLKLGTMESDSGPSLAESQDARSLNELAYHQAAVLRGDTFALMFASATIKFFPRPSTGEDKEFVRAKGLKIYRQLEVARQEQGLPPFKNTVPQFALEYYKGNISYFENSSLEELTYFSIPKPRHE